MDKNILALADAFSEELSKILSNEQLLTIDTENIKRKDNTCASHDYCDPNECMLAAYKTVFLEDFDFDDEGLSVMNPAWTLAKERGFAKPT